MNISLNNSVSNCTNNSFIHHDSNSVTTVILLSLKGFAMFSIIGTALFGNLLVMISVVRFRQLRNVLTNYFIFSLALADFLVAFTVMPFNATLGLNGGTWPFGRVACDLYNANDVLFSTASIMHLSCISMDRYIAIMRPLEYEMKMSRRKVAIMLATSWAASGLISYIPIHTGIYTTSSHILLLSKNPATCIFVVNSIYAIVSSTVSFWIPSVTMLIVYARIFRTARKQEKEIYKVRKLLCIQTPSCNSTALDTTDREAFVNPSCNATEGAENLSTSTRRDTATSRETHKIRREHKAARTLGIIMGAFLLCWLPFFIWYTTSNICGKKHCPHSDLLVDVLFWIGYFNSSLNPMLYACFNKDFRQAFQKLLQYDAWPCRRRAVNQKRINSSQFYRDSLPLK